MSCANCRTDESPAYTLRAHVDEQAEEDATVDLRFCSFECLETWT